jgi:hypothetical protein
MQFCIWGLHWKETRKFNFNINQSNVTLLTGLINFLKYQVGGGIILENNQCRR